MKKRIVIFLLLALTLAFTLCLAACGGSGSEGKDSAGKTYEVIDPVPTSALTRPGTEISYSLKITEDGKATWTKSIVYLTGQKLNTETSVGRYTIIETATGTYEITAESTYVITQTGLSRKIVFDNDADRQIYIDYYTEYGGLNEDEDIAACSESGRTYTAEELAAYNITSFFAELKLIEDINKFIVLKMRSPFGGTPRNYYYDSANRCIKTETETNNGYDEYHYNEEGELTGETSSYTLVVGGVTKVKTTEWAIRNGKLLPTHYTVTEDGVLTIDEYYDENGNVIE